MAESMDAKKPTIVVSRCLGFSHCRYNGDVLSSPFVEMPATQSRYSVPSVDHRRAPRPRSTSSGARL